MNGVTFGTYHSYRDLALILTSKTIEAPVAKTSSVDVPGADGELDYTEYFGDVKYYNRQLSFEFATIIEPSGFLTLFSRLQNLFNGQKMRVVLDDDPDFYYVGRVTVNEWKSNGRIGVITIDVNAEPYKLKKAKTVVTRVITKMTTVNCQNSRKQVTPKISSDKLVAIEVGKWVNGEWKFTDGIYFGPGDLPAKYAEDIVFVEGQNILKFVPTSETTITIEYQEGEL